MEQVKLTKDITDPTGDTDLFIPKGTVVNVLSEEDYGIIAETPDGVHSFPLDPDEYE